MNYFTFANTRLTALIFLLPAYCISLLNCNTNKTHSSEKKNPEILLSPSTNMKLKLIEPGTFRMGASANEFQSDTNEHPQHIVSLTNQYYIGVYEVTQDEFIKTMGFNPSTKNGNSRLPVETLSWFDAITFCNALSAKDGLDSCYVITNIKKEDGHIVAANVVWQKDANGYRLPTEAEWEFACRAGTTTPFPFGNSIGTDKANYSGTISYMESDGSEHLKNETKGIDRGVTLPVDSLATNNWGLYNVVGNVFEWVWDYYDKYPSNNQTDPIGPDFRTERVRRSGAYTSPGYHMRSSLRHGVPPGFALFHMGLRVAKSHDL
jgi:formylglycine-generating enzyme